MCIRDRDGILALPGEADKPNAAYYDSEDPAEAAFMRSLDQDEWLRKTSGLSFVTAVAQNDAYREPAYVIRTLSLIHISFAYSGAYMER